MSDPTPPGTAEIINKWAEQVVRASAEADPSPRYTDGRPKYHRHFGDYEIHIDESCTSSSTRTRVYVFDAEYLDEHEAHIRADERAKAYDDVRTIQNAKRGVR